MSLPLGGGDVLAAERIGPKYGPPKRAAFINR